MTADAPIDPAVRALLDAFGEDDDVDLPRARAEVDALAAAVAPLLGPDGGEDGEVAGVPVRRYAASADGPHLVWLHGGGFVAGSLATADPLCRAAAERTGGPVTSVGYRLAPEHPFPAAVDDALAVVAALDGPVLVAGDSAGAGLAAAVALASDRVRGLLLVCPWLDLTLSAPSVERYGRGYGLTAAALRRYAAMYLGGVDPRVASPLLAPAVGRLPPTVVVTAALDPLRDDGRAWAARLRAAGVPVELREYPSMVHGFIGLATVTPVADEAMAWSVERLLHLTA